MGPGVAPVACLSGRGGKGNKLWCLCFVDEAEAACRASGGALACWEGSCRMGPAITASGAGGGRGGGSMSSMWHQQQSRRQVAMASACGVG